MKAQKFQGYNLDIELGGTAADALLYSKFVSEFAAALHKEGGLLSSDIGGQCGGPDYIGMTCADYKSTPIDMVATMSTCEYTSNLPVACDLWFCSERLLLFCRHSHPRKLQKGHRFGNGRSRERYLLGRSGHR